MPMTMQEFFQKKAPIPYTQKDLLLAGLTDFKSMNGQALRDLWCIVRDKPTGAKSSGALTSKRSIIADILEIANVSHRYPAF